MRGKSYTTPQHININTMKKIILEFKTSQQDYYGHKELLDFLEWFPNLHNEKVNSIEDGIRISFDVRQDISSYDLVIIGIKIGLYLEQHGISKLIDK